MQKKNRLNILLVKAETIVTTTVLSVPIMTPFFMSLGLSHSEIALAQMAYTLVLMVLNVPLGYVADRFGRKWANVIGDLLCACALLCYTQAQGFWFVVGCETIFGLGEAFSQGVDSSLLKHFCDKEDKTGRLFRDQFAKIAVVCEIFTICSMLLGGAIGAISFRLAIGLSSITYIIGAIISLIIKDDSPKLEKAKNGSTNQMFSILRKVLKNPKLKLRVFAYAVVRECSRGIVWVFTPLMMSVGVPIGVVSVGWAINYVAATLGASIAGRYARKMHDWQIFALPVVLVTVASSIMFALPSIFTIWLYAGFGIANGWVRASTMPIIKDHVVPKEQASVESFARVCEQLVYIGAIYVIHWAADIELKYALLATILIFVPIALPLIVALRREVKE